MEKKKITSYPAKFLKDNKMILQLIYANKLKI